MTSISFCCEVTRRRAFTTQDDYNATSRSRREAPPEQRLRKPGGSPETGRRALDGNHGPHGRLRAVRDTLRRHRERIRGNPALDLAYRIVLGVTGAAALVIGLVLIPYPGPGWLIVFAGLGILATEFTWASRVNQYANKQYRAWLGWVRRQHRGVQLVLAAATGAVVLVTLWFLDAFGITATWLDLRWPWWHSPLLGP